LTNFADVHGFRFAILINSVDSDAIFLFSAAGLNLGN